MTTNFYFRTPVTPLCDFCSRTPVAFRYPTKTFTLQESHDLAIGQISHGDWAACEECSDLIERGDRAGLAVRSAENLNSSMPQEDAIAALQLLHAVFFLHRTGNRVTQ